MNEKLLKIRNFFKSNNTKFEKILFGYFLLKDNNIKDHFFSFTTNKIKNSEVSFSEKIFSIDCDTLILFVNQKIYKIELDEILKNHSKLICILDELDNKEISFDEMLKIINYEIDDEFLSVWNFFTRNEKLTDSAIF